MEATTYSKPLILVWSLVVRENHFSFDHTHDIWRFDLTTHSKVVLVPISTIKAVCVAKYLLEAALKDYLLSTNIHKCVAIGESQPTV